MKNANMPKGRGMVKWQRLPVCQSSSQLFVIWTITLPLWQNYGSFYSWQIYCSKKRLYNWPLLYTFTTNKSKKIDLLVVKVMKCVYIINIKKN